jgi:hypothetical protein
LVYFSVLSVVHSSPSLSEKAPQDFPALFFQHSRCNVHPMVQSIIRKQPIERFHGPCLRILRAVYQASHSGLKERSRTHGARFKGCIKRAVQETVISSFCRPFPNRQHFGMGGGIAKGYRPISAPADHFPRVDQNRPDRDFPFFSRPPCFFEGHSHEPFIFAGHGLKIDGGEPPRVDHRDGENGFNVNRAARWKSLICYNDLYFFISRSSALSRVKGLSLSYPQTWVTLSITSKKSFFTRSRG